MNVLPGDTEMWKPLQEIRDSTPRYFPLSFLRIAKAFPPWSFIEMRYYRLASWTNDGKSDNGDSLGYLSQ